MLWYMQRVCSSTFLHVLARFESPLILKLMYLKCDELITKTIPIINSVYAHSCTTDALFRKFVIFTFWCCIHVHFCDIHRTGSRYSVWLYMCVLSLCLSLNYFPQLSAILTLASDSATGSSLSDIVEGNEVDSVNRLQFSRIFRDP